MNKRVNIGQTDPEAYKALIGVEQYITDSNIQPLHKYLIKIRASQINGCAYCIDMHTKEAKKIGETEQRIYLLNAWRETTLYTDEERAILALTEEVTNIKDHISDKTYQEAARLFDEKYLAQLVMMMISINSWNRFAIAGGMMAH